MPAVLKVLLVKVSVVALPTKVSVAAGSVRVVLPAMAVGCTAVVPEVAPLKVKTVPLAPSKQSPVVQSPTLLTSPVSVIVGVAQVPSPLQKVLPVALVPEFKFPTGRFPVTPVAKLTLVIVLLAPLMVLLVKVSVVARPTRVSLASGTVNVLVVPVATPET